VSGIDKPPAGFDIYPCRNMEIWETALKTIVNHSKKSQAVWAVLWKRTMDQGYTLQSR